MAIKKIIFVITIFISIISAQSNNQVITLNAVGDIMLGTDYPNNRLPENDGENLLKDINSILAKADLTIGNYEGVLLDGGTPHKKCNDPTKCYLYRTPTRYVKNLTNAGFDFIGIANNHANDFGSQGMESSKKTLRQAGIKFSGTYNDIAVDTVKGKTVAFIAFATSPGMYSILNINDAVTNVKELSEKYDIVIVSFHGGAEGESALHVSDKMEIAYGEQRGNVIKFTHAVIDAGADLVIGHGPHVPRALELYNEKLIAYSLGNFCTYEGFSLQGSKGVAPILSVELSLSGDLVKAEIVSAKQERPYGPVLDIDKTAFNLMKKLTNQDFPDTKLSFLPSGEIIPSGKGTL